jgi:hypothetical protein
VEHEHDRVWYLSVPKSFFDDALSAGPFEFLIAIGFSFEYLLTNLLFVPFMSGASFNGDLPTMTFGFSAQSDESRHMTLGLEAIKFLLEQDEENVPIVQEWIDKWFWRGYRVTALVAQMLDYMLPRKVMSWKEAFELYFEQQMLGGPLPRTSPSTASRPPKHVEDAIAGEGDPLPPGLLGALPVLARRGLHDVDARTTSTSSGSSRPTPTPSRRSTGRCGTRRRRTWRRRPALRARPAAAVPGLPDPDGLHRARRPDDDLPAADSSTRARSTTSAPTAASGSSSASRRSTSRPGCRCTRSTRATAAEPTLPDVPSRRRPELRS